MPLFVAIAFVYMSSRFLSFPWVYILLLGGVWRALCEDRHMLCCFRQNSHVHDSDYLIFINERGGMSWQCGVFDRNDRLDKDSGMYDCTVYSAS